MLASKGPRVTEDPGERLSCINVLTRKVFERRGHLYVNILGPATLKIGKRGKYL